MTHDSRCENADTPPSDCDCECGGDKHGNGFAEQQIHDLETDMEEVDQLKQLTPDEYFGGENEPVIRDAYAQLVAEIENTDDKDREEQLRNDKQRLEKAAEAKGEKMQREGHPLSEEYDGVRFERNPSRNDGMSSLLNRLRANGLKPHTYDEYKKTWESRREDTEKELLNTNYSIERIKRNNRIDNEEKKDMIEKREAIVRGNRNEMMRIDQNVESFEALKTQKELDNEWSGESDTADKEDLERALAEEAEATDRDETPRHPSEDNVYG